jgi:hypothetical protein
MLSNGDGQIFGDLKSALVEFVPLRRILGPRNHGDIARRVVRISAVETAHGDHGESDWHRSKVMSVRQVEQELIEYTIGQVGEELCHRRMRPRTEEI